MISVIVPVYNGEKYLKQCLNSVINQTIGMENIELIIINDASTDNSLSILKKYQQKWPDNIRIVDRPVNSLILVESNRSLGIKMATGEYVLFLDQDDYYRNDAFQYLQNLMIQNPTLDFIEYSFCYTDMIGNIFNEQHVQEPEFHLYHVHDEKERVEHGVRGILPCSTFAWTKIYRKSFLETNHIEENGKKFQDNFFSGLLNLYCSNFGKCDEVFYYYRNYLGSGSHMKNLNDKTVLMRCQIGLDFYEECKNRGLLADKKLFVEFVFTNTFFIKPFWRLLFMFDPIPYEELREIKNVMRKLVPHVKNNAIVKSRAYIMELVDLLEEEWSDNFLQKVYEKRQQMYGVNGTSFNVFLGR